MYTPEVQNNIIKKHLKYKLFKVRWFSVHLNRCSNLTIIITKSLNSRSLSRAGERGFLVPHSSGETESIPSSGLKKTRDMLLPCGVMTIVTKSDDGSRSPMC